MTVRAASTAFHAHLSYRIPDKVHSSIDQGRIQLTTPSSGRIWVDQPVHDLWRAADQRTGEDILADFRSRLGNDAQILCGLACLAEAGLLERSNSKTAPEPESSLQGETVSIIIVSYNSRPWIKECLDSIGRQTYAPLEIIVVDNASPDGSAEWIESNAASVRLLRFERTRPLAEALNHGIRHAAGKYALLLNPDVRLFSDTIARLVEVAQSDPTCAAVGAKLRLLWAPAFINGLGNLVGALAWGTDIALGHLDLGQFDRWTEIPSACFAAALIPTDRFQSVGMLDEGFPMYYEDSEWCYRARLLGYTILAAPQSVCLHAFSSQTGSAGSASLTPIKLRRVTYGRLRFIARLNSPGNGVRFLINYLMEDVLRGFTYLLKGRWEMIGSLLQGWKDFMGSLPEITKSRKEIQKRRQISDRKLYHLQKQAPTPLIEGGLPVLTWDVIRSEYAPRMLAGETRLLPEISELNELQNHMPLAPYPFWERAYQIWRHEGAAQLFRRMARKAHWRLMQL